MRNLLTSLLTILLALGLAAAQTPANDKKSSDKLGTHATPDLPSEAVVESFLHEQFGYQADVSWKIVSIKPSPIDNLAEVNVVLANGQGQQYSRFYVAPDGQHALVGDIIPFGAKPFDPAKKALEKGISGPSKGPKDAPVTIVEFGDLQCPACKAAQPTIESLVASEPNARFVFQNFPLEMHNWAMRGAEYADCVGRASNEAFWKFVSKTYEHQSDITKENVDEKLKGIAEESGVKGTDIAACADKPETKAHVDASIKLGKEKDIDVTGTPTVFINGRKIGNFDQRLSDVYKSLADFAAKDAAGK
ncbi:MAG TPA: thioredoxin domain-containing protein [Candidatus Eisenbacteria bacterium]|nr:thioredoxin domain-containing protein [Candidatus Eisenbacteria bacterium]